MRNVSDIMRSLKDSSVAERGTCVRDLLETMDAKRLGAVCVVEQGRIVGLITDGDLRRLILRTQDPLPRLFMKRADQIMTPGPKTVRSETSIDECLDLLMKHRFWVVPVVDPEENLVGMVHMHDLIRAKLSR